MGTTLRSSDNVMSAGKQILWGAFAGLFFGLIFLGITGFISSATPKSKPAPSRNITLELQQEQTAELKAIRVVLEKALRCRGE